MEEKDVQASTSPEKKTHAAGQAPQTPGSATDVADEAVNAELEKVQRELEAAKDRFLRAKAETENVRRRAETDVANAHRFAIERFATELLAVRDSLDLAQNVEIEQRENEAVQKMREGLTLTLKLMDDVFAKFSIAIIDPVGEKFDPEKHHALSMVESAEVPPNHVVNVVQKGYLLHDRVLRPAMVMVAKAPTGDAQGRASAAEGRKP